MAQRLVTSSPVKPYFRRSVYPSLSAVVVLRCPFFQYSKDEALKFITLIVCLPPIFCREGPWTESRSVLIDELHSLWLALLLLRHNGFKVIARCALPFHPISARLVLQVHAYRYAFTSIFLRNTAFRSGPNDGVLLL